MIDARAAHDIDGVSDLGELDVVVTLDEGDLVGALLENIGEARTEIVPVAIVLVDLQFSARQNLDDDGAVIRLRLLLIRRRRLRNTIVESRSGCAA